MLKKSRIIAVLSVCVMMFAVVEPACARSWWQVGGDTFVGAETGGVLGGILGGLLVGATVVATGGLAALPLAGAAIGGAAATGATYGAVGGRFVGAVGGQDAVNQYVQSMREGFADEIAGQK